MPTKSGTKRNRSTTFDIIKQYITANPGKSVLFSGLIILGIIALGTIILPELFWDRFIWQYFWGSVVADAEDRTIGNITEGYNVVSTITYGLILAAAVFLIYRLIIVLGIKLDKWFFMAVIPYIMFGGLARALEDAKLFNSPAVYIFISPVIYIVTGLVAIAFMVISHKLAGMHNESDGNPPSKDQNKFTLNPKFISIFTICVVVINIVFLILFLNGQWVNYKINPALPIALSITLIAEILIFSRRFHERILRMPLMFGIFGVLMLSYPISAVAGWYASPIDWTQFYLIASDAEIITLRPEIIPIVLGLSLGATALWAAVAVLASKKTRWKEARLFCSGTNLALVFGQFTDASATFIAIDYFNYWEKHVVPSLLIDVFNTAAVMFLLKTFALILAIYLLDIALRSELKRHSQIIPLVKIAVLVLGLAPGMRDTMRLAMGV